MEKKDINKNVYFILGLMTGLFLGVVITFFMMNNLDKGERSTITEKEGLEIDEVFKVESLYCDYYYPIKWKEKVLIDDTLNVVHFSANLNEDKQIDLFDIVATVDEEDGINVHIVLYELEFDNSWSNEDKQMIVKMQEDVQCIIDYLERENIKVIM